MPFIAFPYTTRAITFRRLVKNSMAPSEVMSQSPYLLAVPDNPPKANGSRGTGIPMLTPDGFASHGEDPCNGREWDKEHGGAQKKNSKWW